MCETLVIIDSRETQEELGLKMQKHWQEVEQSNAEYLEKLARTIAEEWSKRV